MTFNLTEVRDHCNGTLTSLHGFAGVHILQMYFYC